MTPLAERLRPRTLAEYVGQRHLVGPDGPIGRMLASGHISSFILWGPPGVGKTTLAKIIAHTVEAPFYQLSAVNSGVKEVRDVIERASRDQLFAQRQSQILFIDEIHRFSKSQQDSLLAAVETGTVTLIGATTENPSFEVIRPLLSRMAVYVLQPLAAADLLTLAQRAVEHDPMLREAGLRLDETGALLRYSGSDARKLLGILESVVAGGEKVVTDTIVERVLQHQPLAYDKGGEAHYDFISAFIKSVRGSDPQAAVYYLARMLAGGEDPLFIARRLIISASEDIGLANPNALLMATAAFQAVERIGMPEGRIPLAEATIYLATSPKSNSAYMAINAALDEAKAHPDAAPPLHVRNAPTSLLRDLGYADGYRYPHDFPEHFTPQQYMPDALQGTTFWTPADNDAEQRMRARMERWWNHTSISD